MNKFTFLNELRLEFKNNYKLTAETADMTPNQAYTSFLENKIFDIEDMARQTNEFLNDAGIFK